jgi:hypothetical protein
MIEFLTKGRRNTKNSALLIDHYLPEYDVTEVRHTVVEADVETTYESMLTTNLMNLGPIVRALSQLRDAPRRLTEWVRGTTSERPPEQLRIVDVPQTSEWIQLDEAPGKEFVFGAIGKFWQPKIEWRQIDAADFAAFNEPGYAKLAIRLSTRPIDKNQTLLTYEARTATTDEYASQNFRRYWRLIGPFAGYLMSRALDQMTINAETQASQGIQASGMTVKNSESSEQTRPLKRLMVIATLVVAGVYYLLIKRGANE